MDNPLTYTGPTDYGGFDDVYLGPGMQAWGNPEQDGFSLAPYSNTIFKNWINTDIHYKNFHWH